MSIKTAKVGKVMFDAEDVGEVSSASLSVNMGSAETTEIGDTWKTMLSLGKSWSLSLSVYYDPDDAAQAAARTEFISGDGAIASVKMYEDATKYFSGAAIITSFAYTKGINSVDTVSMTIEGNGALAYT